MTLILNTYLGKENVLADCFSRLPRIDKQVLQLNSEPSILGRERPSSPQSVMNFDHANVDFNSCNFDSRKQKRELAGTFVDFKKLESPTDDFDIDGEAFLSHFMMIMKLSSVYFPDKVDPIETVLDLPYIARDSFLNLHIPRESFLNLPHRSMMENPLKMNNIEQHQIHCQELQRLRTVNPTDVSNQTNQWPSTHCPSRTESREMENLFTHFTGTSSCQVVSFYIRSLRYRKVI